MKRLIFILLIFLLCACNDKESHIDIRKIPKEKLSGEIISVCDDILAPRKIFNTKEHIVIFDDNKHDHFLKYISKDTGILDFKFGVIGNGPDEFLMPRIIPCGDKIGILALNKFVFLTTDNHELIKEEKKIKNNKNVIGANYLFFLDDSDILFMKSSESQFYLLNDQSGRESAINAYPLEYRKEYPLYFVNNVIFDAHYSYSEKENIIFAAYKHIPIVSILSVPKFQNSLHVYLDTGDKNEIVKTDNGWAYDNPIYYYTFTDISSKHCYALFQHADKNILRNNQQNSEIHVFDFQGKMIRRLSFDKPTYHFTVSDDDSELYILSLDDNFLPEIWRYYL